MKKLISIIGTTGIGKTKLAIEIAKHFETEIISCDSRQFFKEMNIGTATPSPEELAEVPHHFIGNLSVQDYYSIGQYEKEAIQKIEELFPEQYKNLMRQCMVFIFDGYDEMDEAQQRIFEKTD